MKISPKQYIGIYVAVDVTQSIANLLVLFLLLFPLTMTLLRHNFFKVQLPRAVNATFLLAATVLCFSQMGVTSYDALRSPERKHQKSRLEAPLTAAYVSTYLAGAALVTIYIIISIRTMCKYPTEYNAVCLLSQLRLQSWRILTTSKALEMDPPNALLLNLLPRPSKLRRRNRLDRRPRRMDKSLERSLLGSQPPRPSHHLRNPPHGRRKR